MHYIHTFQRLVINIFRFKKLKYEGSNAVRFVKAPPFLSSLGIKPHEYSLCTDWPVIWFDRKMSSEIDCQVIWNEVALVLPHLSRAAALYIPSEERLRSRPWSLLAPTSAWLPLRVTEFQRSVFGAQTPGSWQPSPRIYSPVNINQSLLSSAVDDSFEFHSKFAWLPYFFCVVGCSKRWNLI